MTFPLWFAVILWVFAAIGFAAIAFSGLFMLMAAAEDRRLEAMPDPDETYLPSHRLPTRPYVPSQWLPAKGDPGDTPPV